MAPTVATSTVTRPDKADVFPRPNPAKVTTADNPAIGSLSRLVLDCASDAYEGKQAAAAAQVGKDEGNFSRDMKRIADVLQRLGPGFLARFGGALVNEYGPVSDPISRALQLQQEITDRTAELVSIIVGSAS